MTDDRWARILQTPEPEMVIWTLGHSTRPIDEFLTLLSGHGIQRLADIRTVPQSRRHPQFGQSALARSLADAGIGYAHLRGLGGLRRPRPDSINTAWRHESFRGYADHMQTADFRTALDELLALGARERVAVMCAEAVPWRCHRQLVADALLVRGVEALEIVSPGKTRPHELTPWARVEGQRLWYPGVV
jgi:uncharacterized protein (DUF488 family)